MGIPFRTWGQNIDRAAFQQMENACSLPITVSGALMPDAHVGYGLPIGGVLATEGAVIPYAVGVDIACRVMLSVTDLPVDRISTEKDFLSKVLDEQTRFGVGGTWENRKHHPVMDEAWNETPIVSGLKDLAWKQLGTSGSGNHFVEFGVLEVEESILGLDDGRYLAFVSHSGSRGPGSKIALHYSSLAQSKHPKLPKELVHLAWLSMDEDGEEYWSAMELMGRYASANHHVIHKGILQALGAESIFRVENHHNFAWKEEHGGRELIVHRKGATPAGKGNLGFIPGTMVDPGFVVQGLGEESSLSSCAHGAGRVLSRNQAKKSTSPNELNKLLKERGVHLLSAGLDESPHAYKNIHEVMNDQRSLAKVLAKFTPKIVKMAPHD